MTWAGRSTAMAFEGTLLSRPSDPVGERDLSEALLVEYFGVYVPVPAVDVLSPNGDGVDSPAPLSTSGAFGRLTARGAGASPSLSTGRSHHK